MKKGKGVCILLEGLDEAPGEMWNSLLPELITGKRFPLLSYILTARPGCQQLKPLESKVTSKIAIRGFDKMGIVKFINLGSTSN